MRRPTPTSPPDAAPGPPADAARATLLLVLGCLLVGASSAFIKLSGASADTAAFLRCALALLVFAPLAVLEWRRFARPPARMVRYGLAAGVLLGADYLMWTQSILDAGAAVATVLIGVQVVVFPVLARAFDGERLSRRFLVALPIMLVGLGLTGGLLAADATAPHPVRGAVLGTAAGVCYAGFLYLVRPASDADRRLIATPTGLATASAAVVVGVVGVLTGGIDLALEPHAWLWLAAVAFGGQALSFILIGFGTARLPAGRAAAVMLLQPVAAVVLGPLLLDERPAGSQYAGMALTVAAIAVATAAPRTRGPRRPGTT